MFSRTNHWQRKRVVPDRRYHNLNGNHTLVHIPTIEALKSLFQKISPALHTNYFRLKDRWANSSSQAHLYSYYVQDYGRPVTLCELRPSNDWRDIQLMYSPPDARYTDEYDFWSIQCLAHQAKKINAAATLVVCTPRERHVNTRALSRLGFLCANDAITQDLLYWKLFARK